MKTIVGLVLSGIVLFVLWVLNERQKAQRRKSRQSYRQYMLQNGTKTSIPYQDIVIKTTYDRQEVFYDNQYMALEMQTNGKGPEYEHSFTTYLTYKTMIGGKEYTVYSQPYPVDKQYMLFALMGKDYIDVYTLPEQKSIYFDLEVAEQD